MIRLQSEDPEEKPLWRAATMPTTPSEASLRILPPGPQQVELGERLNGGHDNGLMKAYL